MLPALGIFVAQPVAAATLYPAPASGSYNVGDTFTVGVYVSSEDQAINAVSGVLNVPREKLEIVSVSARGSIINLWVRDPSFSASAGTAAFEGIVLNPGFKGSGGQIMVMTLKAVGPGIATVNFSAGVVLANDGNGTNILRGMGSAQFTIAAADLPSPLELEEEPKAAPKEEKRESPREAPKPSPEIPVVVSETHPDPDAWYVAKDVKLSWGVPEGATAVRLLVSRDPDDAPSVLYDTPIDSLKLNNLDDGAWYLHVQFYASLWSEIVHFRFRIDAQPPDVFELTEIPRPDPTEPVVRFSVNATDTTSGIDHYDMFIDGQEAKMGLDGVFTSLTSPVLGPGDHVIAARAIDRAGNEREATALATVKALTAPLILQYPLSIERGDVFFLRGITEYPNAHVTLWVQGEGREPIQYEFMSDANGAISFLTKDRLPNGEVSVWLTVRDDRGASSDPSDHVSVIVNGFLLSDLWPWLSYTLLIVVAVLVWILWKSRYELSVARQRFGGTDLRKEYIALEEELRTLRAEVEAGKRIRKALSAKQRSGKKAAKPAARRRAAGTVKKFAIGNRRGLKRS